MNAWDIDPKLYLPLLKTLLQKSVRGDGKTASPGRSDLEKLEREHASQQSLSHCH